MTHGGSSHGYLCHANRLRGERCEPGAVQAICAKQIGKALRDGVMVARLILDQLV